MGDKYMTVSGLPETCHNHAKCISRLALDLMDVAQNVMMGSAPVVSQGDNGNERERAFDHPQRVGGF